MFDGSVYIAGSRVGDIFTTADSILSSMAQVVHTNTTTDPTPTNTGAATQGALYNQIRYVGDLLSRAGMTPGSLVETYAIAQVMHETGGLTSNLARKYNNLSGIKYINKPYQKNAYLATNGYAGFKTDQDWANDYVRILSLSPGKPINATSFQQFYNGLATNGYFVPAEAAEYSAGLNNWIRKISAAINAANAQWAQIQKTGVATAGDWTPADTAAVKKQEQDNWWKDLPTWEKVGIGAGALLLAVAIVKN